MACRIPLEDNTRTKNPIILFLFSSTRLNPRCLSISLPPVSDNPISLFFFYGSRPVNPPPRNYFVDSPPAIAIAIVVIHQQLSP
jgi:hypothetical protein